jgi:dihydrofolate synthase/folylpolyglutamate synthase
MFSRIGKKAYKADLNNTIALCQYLSNPQHQFRSIHVAGTNGKGSTSHMLAAILQSAGYRTGLYTSPHLKSFTERIRIDGKEVPQKDVIQFVAAHQPYIEDLAPSFFELTVGMAFDYFARERVDIAVIEVGLGGRLDSTNVIRPELSVITNISYDHQDILGDTLPQIAFEKAGIIKHQVPVVISEWQPEIADVFREKAAKEEAPIYFATDHYQVIHAGTTENALITDVYKGQLLYLPGLKCQLTGQYQLHNLAGVLQAVDVLKERGFAIGEAALRKGIAEVSTLTGLKGRWEILQRNPLVICDTGHNESGIREVVEHLNQLSYERLYCVIGMVNDKDLSHILPLFPKSAYYYFCQAQIPRALPAHDLQQQASKYGLTGEVIASVKEAVNAAKQKATSQDLIFIGGSTFTVAEV